MSDSEFDAALIRAAFLAAGRDGWDAVSVAGAAREAGLSLSQARERFPSRAAILLRFGRLADQLALTDPPAQGTVRDRLFYMLMQRLDAMQEHRAGVLALLRYLPTHPAAALFLEMATRTSMRWLLEAAGVSTRGLRGEVRVRGLLAIWLWTMRSWQSDESADMSATMSAVDDALARAERLAGWMGERDPGDPAAEAGAELDPGPVSGPGPEPDAPFVPPPEPESPPPPGLGDPTI